MSFIDRLFGDDKDRFYNRKAFEQVNQTLDNYKEGDYIIFRSYDDGILVQQELYKVLNIVMGECKGDNRIIRTPQFYVENIISGKRLDLIQFTPYTTKTGTPAYYRNAKIRIGYPKGTYSKISIADNLEVKQILECEISRRSEEKRRQEAIINEKKMRDIENSRISSSEINDLVNVLRKE